MAIIKVLPEEVTRQIAAGEVVERPASVVKELIENALDAGATNVSIRASGAGSKLVEVRDNGTGMSHDDVAMAPKSFATSKIEGADDLFSVKTYGFRGEALASISAVSRFAITASDGANGEGWRFAVEGKSILENNPAPHERGTTVKVEDLFFNMPARRKFLKSDVTERKRILETVLSFALVTPEVEFHYTDDGRSVLDLVPEKTWRGRVAAILGASTMKHMVEASTEEPPLRVRGFVSLPTYTRGNRNHEFFFVNGRQVREKTILSAVQDAYRGVIPYKRFPVVVLAVDIPFEEVDVNVHPSKLEVRFRNPRRIFDVVRCSVKQALSAHSESGLEVSYETNSTSVVPEPQRDLSPVPSLGYGHDTGGKDDAAARMDAYKSRIKDAYGTYMEGSTAQHDLNPQLSLQTGTRKVDTPAVESLEGRIQEDERLFWQFDNTYILIQVRGGIVMIDQHAAHERIIFDTSKKRLESEIPLSQQILFPINLELSLSELELFRTSKDIFRKLGFHLEPFGGKSILVRGYPQGLKNWDEGKLLLQIFDDILQDRAPGENHVDRIIASFACHSAVRAGQRLGVPEMKMLADQLFAVENPYSCPHGRPTIQRISLEEIESWFLRR